MKEKKKINFRNKLHKKSYNYEKKMIAELWGIIHTMRKKLHNYKKYTLEKSHTVIGNIIVQFWEKSYETRKK